MRYFGYALVYIAFYGLIAAAIYFTYSLIPLLGLFFTPELSISNSNSDKNSDSGTTEM